MTGRLDWGLLAKIPPRDCVASAPFDKGVKSVGRVCFYV